MALFGIFIAKFNTIGDFQVTPLPADAKQELNYYISKIRNEFQCHRILKLDQEALATENTPLNETQRLPIIITRFSGEELYKTGGDLFGLKIQDLSIEPITSFENGLFLGSFNLKLFMEGETPQVLVKDVPIFYQFVGNKLICNTFMRQIL